MDFKWLEDFLSLAATHSFSRAAEVRGVTQSAFSRRIRALEEWLCADFVNRETHPLTLTEEGKLFRETAEDAVRMLSARQAEFRHRAHSGVPQIALAFEVIGNDVTITFAAEAGQLQLNAFEPIIAYSLFRSAAHLEAACRTLETRCIRGITAIREALRVSVEHSIGLVTAPNPYIGYEAATKLAIEAFHPGRGVYDLVLEGGLMTKDHLDRVLHPDALTRPQLRM
jgi:hypothetical protein